MEEPPPPLTPADCDLRDFLFMPWDCARFCDSSFASIEDPEAFRGGVLAWTKSWHQIPAASLPDDDRQLCSLLGYGRDIELWKRTRAAGALRGFVRCADGRIYHPVVAEKALHAWDRKQRQRENGRKGNAKRWSKASVQEVPASSDSSSRDWIATTAPSPPDGHPIGSVSSPDYSSIASPSPPDRKGEGEGEGEKKESPSGDSLAGLDGAVSAPAKGEAEARKGSGGKSKGWATDAPFQKFRAAYPKTDRAPARTHRAWLAALKKSPALSIISALNAHPFAAEEQFRPDPATWLNGESWHVTSQRPDSALTGMINGVRPAPGVVRDADGHELTLERFAELGI